VEEFIDINGKNIFIKSSGNGDPIIFLHSSLLTSSMWNSQIEYFSKKYKTIAFDFCGYGKSELPKGLYSDYEDLKNILDKKNVDKAIIAGKCLNIYLWKIKNCGHLPNMEKGEELNKIIEGYIN
jgi:pimeloyl-ACP methyl ester carboxylesterase